MIDYKIIRQSEIDLLEKNKSELIQEIEDGIAFIKEIESGNLYAEYQNKSSKNTDENSLAGSLLDMQKKLIRFSEDEQRRNWIAEGLAHFSVILREDSSNIDKFTDNVLSSLVRYIGATQGSFFLVSNLESKPELDLKASYAFNRKKYIEKKIQPGQGLIGQCFLEKELFYLTEIPEDYIKINSGLGEANPKNLILLPLKNEELVYGVIELASFKKIEDYKIDFIQKLAENICGVLVSNQINSNTAELLKKSQAMTEQLQTQEESMRQNFEELAATQEELQRKEVELEKKLQEALNEIHIQNTKNTLDEINQEIENILKISKQELTFVSKTPPVQEIFTALKAGNVKDLADWKERFTTITSALLKYKNQYRGILFYSIQHDFEIELCYDQFGQLSHTNGYIEKAGEMCLTLKEEEIFTDKIKLFNNSTFFTFILPVYHDKTLSGFIILQTITEELVQMIHHKEKSDTKFAVYTESGQEIYDSTNEQTEFSGIEKICLLNQKNNYHLHIKHFENRKM